MKKISLIVLLLISIMPSWLHAEQTVSPKKTLSNEPSVSSGQDSTSVQQEIQHLKTEAAILKERVDAIYGRMNLLITVLVVILAIGGITSLVSWFFAERRTREAHSLAIEAGWAAHERTEEVHHTFLAGSKTTLALVNDTLTLAKEASERAAKTIETKASATLRELDKKSRELFVKGPKQLIAEPALRSQLHRLAQKIASFEISILYLPSGLELTPHCHFIRGMAFHLDQQFDDALDRWNSAALDIASPNELKSQAWYWIGLENNNLGEFSEACRSFEESLKITTGGEQYELKRILNESRFFDKKKYRPETLILPLENLCSSIEKEANEPEFNAKRIRILVTLANIYFQCGHELIKANNKSDADKNYRLAKERFRRAYTLNNEDQWASCGLAETLCRLDEEREEVERIFRWIKLKAIDEYISKEEPRSKVLALTAEIISCLSLDLRDEVGIIRNQLLEALSRVDERLTVYSLMQRRNVKKDEFKKDLDELMTEWNYEAR